MTVTSEHVEPESAALRGVIPEGPLCFHEPQRARRGRRLSSDRRGRESKQVSVANDVPQHSGGAA
jgi:hypothetical protein